MSIYDYYLVNKEGSVIERYSPTFNPEKWKKTLERLYNIY